jgi:glycosyltransferase involved in cell wall biosynthesis
MFFTDTYPPQQNGVAFSVSGLAQALARHGHSVMVYAVRTKRGLAASTEESFPVVRVHTVPVPFYRELGLAAPLSPSLMQCVSTFAPDVIHCHTPFGVGWQAVRIARACHIPLLGTHHTFFGAYVPAYSPFGRRVTRHLMALMQRYVAGFYSHCALVTCASQRLEQDLTSAGCDRRIVIIPNGTDTTVFRPLPRAATVERPLRLLYLGRLASEKNLPRLVELLEPVLKGQPRVQLDLVGRGPMAHELAAQIRRASLDNRVRLIGAIGQRDMLAAYIADCDICVTASLTENHPLSLLEGLACGLPVVALGSGGIPEIIRDGYNGFLVDPGDSSGGFAARVKQLVADHDLRSRMSGNARTSADAYSIDTQLPTLLTVYEQALALARRH